MWTLCQLMSQLSNAGDPGAFAALFVGVAELVEDVAEVHATRFASSAHSWRGGHHGGHGHVMVLCSFREALRRICAAEGGPDTPPQRSTGTASNAAAARATTTTSTSSSSRALAPEVGLMVEVGGADAAAALATAACKLTTHALRLSPQAATGFLAPSTARACATLSSSPAATIATRRAAINALRAVAAESSAATFPARMCLAHIAVTFRERVGNAPGVTPSDNRERETFDAELAACAEACLAAASVDAVVAAGDALARAAAAAAEAGEGAMGKTLRAAGMRALRACVAARPSLVTALVPLLPHAGSDDVADALADGFERAFEEETGGNGTGIVEGDGTGIAGTVGAEKTHAKRRRISSGKDGWAGGGGGGRGAGEPRPPPSGESASSPGSGRDDATLTWIEECIVAALSQLGPNAVGGGGGIGGHLTQRDWAAAAPSRARAAAGISRAAAGASRRRPRLRRAANAAVHEWLKWTRRAHDAGDGATAEAFAAVLDAADALLRAEQRAGRRGDGAGSIADAARCSVPQFNEDDLHLDVLLWPWSAGADEAPAEAKRVAKTASLRAALAANAARASPTAAAASAMKKTLQAGFHDGDDVVRASAACATPAAHVLADVPDVRPPLALIATVAAQAGAGTSIRAAVATAVGGLAAASAAPSRRAGSLADVALRARIRDAGQRAVAAVAKGNAVARDDAAAAFDAAVVDAIERGGTGGAEARASLAAEDASRTLTSMLSLDEDADVASAALVALNRVIKHARGSDRALRGAAALCEAATPLALHPSAKVRDALRATAPALASRGALLDAADAMDTDAMDTDDDRAVIAAGLSLLQRLKTNVEEAADAATRESALRTFAAAAAALPHPDALTAALIVILHRLDDADAGVRAAAVELVRAAAARRGVRPRELLLGNRLVATHLGVALPNSPGLLAALSEALLHAPERNVLVELLPAAVPRLVERQDVATLRAYAKKLGPEYNVSGILQDWCYTAIADLINNSAERTTEEVEACKKFLVSHTNVELEVLVADHKKELMRALIRSAGADDAADPQLEAGRLQQVLGTLAKLAASSSSSGAADTTPTVPDFLRPHFTWLVMGDANDRRGDAAAQRRFLRSLTIMVYLIGPHLPQFAPKVMAHLASALERPSSRLRRDALAAWLLVVKQLAEHAPDHLRRVAGRVVVAMLPHLPDDGGGGGGGGGNARDADRRASFGGGGGDDDDDADVDNTAAAAEVIDELVLRSGAKYMRGRLARLPMLPACERLARANAAVSKERGEVALESLLATLVDGAEDESQAVRATALGELRRALRADPGAVSALLAGAEEDATAPAVVGRLVAALLRCCASENRTVVSRRVQRLAAQCIGELGALDPGRVDLPVAPAEKLGDGTAGPELAKKLLCEHIARAVRGANDVDMLDAAALAAQEVLVHVGCRPASVRAEDVVAADRPDAAGHLPDEATREGVAFWTSLPEDVRVLLAPALTSMYCLTQKPAKPPAQRPLYQAPGGPTFRRWTYAWCRALAAEATGRDAPLFAACSAGMFRHDTRAMLFLLPRMVLDAVSSRDETRIAHVRVEITAVLNDAAGVEGDQAASHAHAAQKSTQGEQAELAAQTVFTLLDQLTAWRDDAASREANGFVEEDALASLLDAVPRKLLARAALRCGAPARALLYFEEHIRAEKNVMNQAALRNGDPEGGGLDDEEASFLAATHRGLAEPDALEAVARLRSRCGAGGSGAVAAARRRAEDALLQHEQAGEWTEALTHYESALQRGGERHGRGHGRGDASERHPDGVGPGDGSQTAALEPAEWGRLRCLQGLGHLRALEREAEALIAQRPAARAELAEAGAAAAWRLGRWDSLEGFLGVLDANAGGGAGIAQGAGGFGGADGRPGGEAAVGRALLGLHNRDAAAVSRAAAAARDAVITPLAAAAMEGSYRRAHPAIVQLHLIRESEEAMAAVSSLDAAAPRGGAEPRGAALLSDWERRLELTPSALTTREPILALRRATYAALGARDAAAYTWLAQAKLCRASGHHGAAQLALLEARSALEAVVGGDARANAGRGAGRPAPGMALAVEQAKLLWATGRQHRATVEIQEALDDSALRGADPLTTSRAMLRLARWSAATGQRSKQDVLNIYSNVLRDQKHTEKANFHVAKYMDDLLKDAARREQRRAATGAEDRGASGGGGRRGRHFDVDERSIDYVLEVILHYATSLRYGHRHVYESLPRMLTLWFDVGAAAAAHEVAPSGRGSKSLTSDQQRERKVATAATNTMKDFTQRLPLYTWLPALPLLTARLCHPHAEVRQLIHELLYRLVKNFPNQVLWSMTAMARSTVPDRANAAQRVLDRAKDAAPSSVRPLFDQSAALSDQLIRVCAFQPKALPNGRPAKTFSVREEFPALRRLCPCAVMVPGMATLTPSLPPPTLRNAANSNQVPTVSEWSAFAADVATIESVEDEVPVLSSLQKPKKLTVVGSDGQTYAFLCKPKDDLRKDLRMMEFTTVLNRLLARDPSSRKRRLYLRTFAVIPLTEDCGLIEWVPNTTGLRHVIQALYVKDGLYHKRTLHDVKDMHERLKATPQTWMAEILKKFPPVLHRWFLNRWKDRPAAWHGARTAFAHTAAVWSMVGHVVGLGDRHGENILLDQESGDCVHVDFSCLFDKGLELETPEMVPFRLTQNIVDGLGVGGYEGTFMRVCEITLGVLRSHREALMSVLETFVHDPLVEWSKGVKAGGGRGGGGGGRDETAEAERGKEALEKIKSRLEGVVVGVGSAPSLPLSPQGQARRLIEEATARKSLGAMYIWWMSWF